MYARINRLIIANTVLVASLFSHKIGFSKVDVQGIDIPYRNDIRIDGSMSDWTNENWFPIGANSSFENLLSANGFGAWNEAGLISALRLDCKELRKFDCKSIILSYFIDEREISFKNNASYGRGVHSLTFSINIGEAGDAQISDCRIGMDLISKENYQKGIMFSANILDDVLDFEVFIPWLAPNNKFPGIDENFGWAILLEAPEINARLSNGDEKNKQTFLEENPESFEIFFLRQNASIQGIRPKIYEKLVNKTPNLSLLAYAPKQLIGKELRYSIIELGIINKPLKLNNSLHGQFAFWNIDIPMMNESLKSLHSVTLRIQNKNGQIVTTKHKNLILRNFIASLDRKLDSILKAHVFSGKGKLLKEYFISCSYEVAKNLGTFDDGFRPVRRRFRDRLLPYLQDINLEILLNELKRISSVDYFMPYNGHFEPWVRDDGTVSAFFVSAVRDTHSDNAIKLPLRNNFHGFNRSFTQSYFAIKMIEDRELTESQNIQEGSYFIDVHTYGAGNNFRYAGVPEVREIIKSLRPREDVDLDRVVFSGNSIGGGWAVWMATRMPDLPSVITSQSGIYSMFYNNRDPNHLICMDGDAKEWLRNLEGKKVLMRYGDLDDRGISEGKEMISELIDHGVDFDFKIVKNSRHADLSKGDPLEILIALQENLNKSYTFRSAGLINKQIGNFEILKRSGPVSELKFHKSNRKLQVFTSAINHVMVNRANESSRVILLDGQTVPRSDEVIYGHRYDGFWSFSSTPIKIPPSINATSIYLKNWLIVYPHADNPELAYYFADMLKTSMSVALYNSWGGRNVKMLSDLDTFKNLNLLQTHNLLLLGGMGENKFLKKLIAQRLHKNSYYLDCGNRKYYKNPLNPDYWMTIDFWGRLGWGKTVIP